MSTTGRRRWVRTSWRASLAAMAISQGPHLVGVAQGAQPTPGDRPGGLDGVAGRLGIAADDERDASHRSAVLRDEAREGGLVTLGGETDGGGDGRCVVHGDVRHER